VRPWPCSPRIPACLRCARIVLVLSIWSMLAACSNETIREPVSGELSVSAPKTAHVGEQVIVRVGPVYAPDETPVTLVAAGSYGPRIYRAGLEQGMALFVLEAEDTHYAGHVSLVACVDQARGETGMVLLPGPPVEPLTPLIGARSIIADGAHWSMIVVVPFDRYGNPVARDTPVQVRISHPGDSLEVLQLQVRHLVAWARIYSGTRAGRTAISVQSHDAYGSEGTLLEIPGWPVPFGLTASPASLPADGWKLITLGTNAIQDRFGNEIPDGTLVTFVTDMPDGRQRIIPAYALDGAAEAPLQAPSVPGIAVVRAVVYGMESEPLHIDFAPGPAVNTFALVAHVDVDRRVISFTAGPMLGGLSQHTPDGTSVRFCLTDTDQRRVCHHAVSEDGYAVLELRLAELAPGDYQVQASTGVGMGETKVRVP
jgi:hypothetical protein